jgi:endonuclease/exonuclease/phosphatase family metal-dependent hydrolase
MKLTTFNLWHGLNSKGILYFDALEPQTRTQLRYELQIEVLKALQSDVLFLQEVNPLSDREDEFKSFNAAVFGQNDNLGVKLFGLGLPWNLDSGLMICLRNKGMARWLMSVKLSGSPFSLDSPWLSLQVTENRYAMFVEWFDPEVGSLLLVDTHLHHGPEYNTDLKMQILSWATRHQVASSDLNRLEASLKKGDERRRQELGHLFEAVDSLKSKFAAVVIAGDMNFTPDNSLHQLFTDRGFSDCAAGSSLLTFDASTNDTHHLTADFVLPVDIPEGLTEPARADLHILLLNFDQRPRRIDSMFVWAQDRSCVVRDLQLVKSPPEAKVQLSDHYGLCVDLEFV